MTWIIPALLSAFFAALVAIFAKKGLSEVDTTLATAIRAVIMAVFLALAAAILGKAKLLGTLDSKAYLFILLSGVAGAVSWFFYFVALKSGPASGVVAVDRLSVVLVLILAVVFLGEGLTWKSALGAVLVTGGALLFTLK